MALTLNEKIELLYDSNFTDTAKLREVLLALSGNGQITKIEATLAATDVYSNAALKGKTEEDVFLCFNGVEIFGSEDVVLDSLNGELQFPQGKNGLLKGIIL